MFVVDTNVLLYAANGQCAEHDRCLRLVSEWRETEATWCVTWGILYEFLSVSTHRKETAHAASLSDSWRFIDGLLQSPGLQVLTETDRHAAIAEATFAEVPDLSGRHLHDAHVAILMREHGISRIVTRDTRFHRFPFLEVVDPLAGSWELHASRPGGPNAYSRQRRTKAPRRPRVPASRPAGRR